MDELKSRIYALLKDKQLMPVATLTEDDKPWVRYVVGVGSEDLTVRFVTSLQTRKIAHIRRNPDVHMAFGASSMESTGCYGQIMGTAEITTEKEERDRMWDDALQDYFNGPDDPNYCVVIIKPRRIELMGMSEMMPQVWEADK